MAGQYSLADLPVGSIGMIIEVQAAGNTKRRLLDLGFVPDTVVKVLRRSPTGDPVAYQLRGAVIALRKENSRDILVRPL
ncbi:MAG TPA: ferrous iron transport protein A [Firmicutes bacterium]|nr:ferrous iron transport protein A [Bacillota bacterium]